MKEFRNGSDTPLFKKEDIIELVQKLNMPERKMLKARLASMNEHEQSRAFSTIRTWVLRKAYPDKFKSSVPFYEELKDILNIED